MRAYASGSGEAGAMERGLELWLRRAQDVVMSGEVRRGCFGASARARLRAFDVQDQHGHLEELYASI